MQTPELMNVSVTPVSKVLSILKFIYLCLRASFECVTKDVQVNISIYRQIQQHVKFTLYQVFLKFENH